MDILPQSEPTPETPACDVCTHLRTKNAYGGYFDPDSEWFEGNSTTAVFWCLRTMSAAGPDEQFAHAHTCKAGRSCFRSRDE